MCVFVYLYTYTKRDSCVLVASCLSGMMQAERCWFFYHINWHKNTLTRVAQVLFRVLQPGMRECCSQCCSQG